MFPTHLEFLRHVKAELAAHTYFEIGVAQGYTLFDRPMAPLTIGVDPAFALSIPLDYSWNVALFRETSDDFFAKRLIHQATSAPIDFAFIDGLHQSDTVIRDFRNAESISHRSSMIAIHDIYPKSAAEAGREINRGGNWMGDVFKATHALRKFRPDLKVILISDVPLSGIAIVYNLDPGNNVLWETYDEVVRYMDHLDYDRDFAAEVLPTFRSVDSAEFADFSKTISDYRHSAVAHRQRRLV